jgi:hypothetical protein
VRNLQIIDKEEIVYEDFFVIPKDFSDHADFPEFFTKKLVMMGSRNKLI